MSVTLACTFRPINDLDRFVRLRPQLEEAYKNIVLVVPPIGGVEKLEDLEPSPTLRIVASPDRALSRYLALQNALETETTHVLCADLDRLMRWMEVAPVEWQSVGDAVQRADCLILGRTERAFQTHPQALQQTERIINAVFSHRFGQPVDLGGGARGFSRDAAAFVVKHARPDAWSDAAWPLLAQRAGFKVDYLALDCNDWETADRYLGQVADPDLQRREAEKRDQDPKQWEMRVRVARDIIEAGLEALRKSLGDLR